MKIKLILGLVLLSIIVLGFIHPLLTINIYTPIVSPKVEYSLVKAIYNTLLQPRIEYTSINHTINLTAKSVILRIRSSLVFIRSGCRGIIEFKDIANIPSEYTIARENGITVITVIGYEVHIDLPCNMSKFSVDARLSYVDMELINNTIPENLDIHVFGSIVNIIDNVSKAGVLSLTLEDSLLELTGRYHEYRGERVLELKTTSSIAYLSLYTSKNVKLRIIKENIGGIVDVEINDSYVYEKYYIDEEYYESPMRLHIGVTSIGSGVKISIYRLEE